MTPAPPSLDGAIQVAVRLVNVADPIVGAAGVDGTVNATADVVPVPLADHGESPTEFVART